MSPRLRKRRAAAAIAAVIAVGSGCGSQQGAAKPTASTTPRPSAEVASLLSGIPERGDTLGDANAPVTLQYFGDLQCPFCREFTLDVLPSLIQRWVRAGKLKIEYLSLETATRTPPVFKAQQLAALAAGGQDKMWYFLELFYHEQGRENSGYVTESYLQGLAQQVAGLNLIAWTVARNEPALASTLGSDALLAGRARFTGTPSFLIDRTGGTIYRLKVRTISQATPYDAAIEKLLKSPVASSPQRSV